MRQSTQHIIIKLSNLQKKLCKYTYKTLKEFSKKGLMNGYLKAQYMDIGIKGKGVKVWRKLDNLKNSKAVKN